MTAKIPKASSSPFKRLSKTKRAVLPGWHWLTICWLLMCSSQYAGKSIPLFYNSVNQAIAAAKKVQVLYQSMSHPFFKEVLQH